MDCLPERLEYLPAVPAREITPWSRAGDVYGDALHRDHTYTNWRPKGSGDWLLIYTEAGAGRLHSARGTCETRPGEVILYAPGEPQDYSTADGHWDLLWAHFTPPPDWRPGHRWPRNPAQIRSVELPAGELREHFRRALLRMIGLVRRHSPSFLPLSQNALAEALLWTDLAIARQGAAEPDARIVKAREYLTTNVRLPFDLKALARHSGLSVSRLACLFKEQIGSTPQQFFERTRMQSACQLLRRTSLSVAQIAEEAGYADPFYFSNRFRRCVGETPSAYRQRGRDG